MAVHLNGAKVLPGKLASLYCDGQKRGAVYDSGQNVSRVASAAPAIPITGIDFTPKGTIRRNTTQQLTVLFTPENTTERRYEWSSTNPARLWVDENDVLCAGNTAGGVTITLTSLDNPNISIMAPIGVN